MQKFKFVLPYFLFFLISILSIGILSSHGRLLVGDDTTFLFSRIFEFNYDIKYHNNFSNLYSFNSFGNVGSAVQNFYPNRLLFIIQFFNSILHNILASYYISLIFILFIGLIIGFHSFLLLSKNRSQAFIFAIAFGLSNYQLFNVTSRFDIGEWAALFFMPLAFASLYKILKTNSIKSTALLSIALGLILATHVLSIMLITIIFTVICLLYFLIDHTHFIQKAVKIFLAYVIMLLLNLPFTINLFKLHNLIHQPLLVKYPFDNILSYMQVITFSLSNRLEFSLGLFFIITLIFGLLNFKKLPTFYQLSFIIMILLSMLITNIFPWAALNNTPLKVIQFPWRFIGIDTVFVALLVSYIINVLVTHLHQKYHLSRLFILSLSIIGIVFLQLSIEVNNVVSRFHQSTPYVATTNSTVPMMIKAHESQINGSKIAQNKDLEKLSQHVNLSTNTLDYWPQKSVPFMQSILMQQVLSPNNQAHLVGQPKQRNNVVTINVVSQKVHVNLDLPILNYANQYTMFVNGKKTSYTVSKRGTLEFNTPAKQIQIKLLPKLTPLYHNLNLISNILWIAIILGLVINMLFKRFKPQFAFD